jgi:hypothetical protein
MDKLWKTLGLTGMHEAKEKSRLWENSQIDKAYSDKQKKIIDIATKQYGISGTLPKDFATRYIAAQGDPSTLERELNTMIQTGSMDQKTAQTIYNAASPSITATHKLMRLQGKE